MSHCKIYYCPHILFCKKVNIVRGWVGSLVGFRIKKMTQEEKE